LGLADEIIPAIDRSALSVKKQVNLATKRNKRALDATLENIYSKISTYPKDSNKIKQLKRKDCGDPEIVEAIIGQFMEQFSHKKTKSNK